MICVKCEKFMKCKENGVLYEEGMPTNYVDGEPQEWSPYKLWYADLYKCDGCGVEIISGRGKGPIREHYEKDYLEFRDSHPPLVTVNDCPGPYREPDDEGRSIR
jgi:hypothetical protein